MSVTDCSVNVDLLLFLFLTDSWTKWCLDTFSGKARIELDFDSKWVLSTVLSPSSFKSEDQPSLKIEFANKKLVDLLKFCV